MADTHPKVVVITRGPPGHRLKPVAPPSAPKAAASASEPNEYPRWVKVDPSWIVKSEKTFQEMHDTGHWNHIVDPQAVAKQHITAGPQWPEFHVHATGIVDVKVNDAEQEAKATSPQNPT